jgi:hypothetical protein
MLDAVWVSLRNSFMKEAWTFRDSTCWLENVTEARRRFPHLPFAEADIEAPEITRLGKFDVVLCLGLLYHLESPLLAIRRLQTLT